MSSTTIGDVTWEKFAAGSKSECETTILRTENGEKLRLLQPGVSPYRQEILKTFAGHKCQVVGSRKGARFYVESIKAIDASGLSHHWLPDGDAGIFC